MTNPSIKTHMLPPIVNFNVDVCLEWIALPTRSPELVEL